MDPLTSPLPQEMVANWRRLCSCDDICTYIPHMAQYLLDQIEIRDEDTARRISALRHDALAQALELLLSWFCNVGGARWLISPLPPAGTDVEPEAERILADEYTFYSQTDRILRRADGGLDWDYQGPTGDQEWAWALNRHFHLGILLEAFLKTGNPRYAARIDQDLRDWIIHSFPYPARQSSSAMWRGLEIHFRAKRWTEIFFRLQQSPEFKPATRILVLLSLIAHAHYLRHFHKPTGNWIAMELCGLTAIATRIPEYRFSDAYLHYAEERLQQELHNQFYPDGAQKELTAGYHWVTLHNFEEFSRLCAQAGLSVADSFHEGIERACDYLAALLRPNGCCPLNNDSDRIDFSTRIAKAAETYRRPDWAFMVSHGKTGEKPSGSPSRFFPWCGQLVSRSGWDEDAHWSFFDAGPWGIAHQHTDKLHLSLTLGADDILVDSGRFAYRGELARFRRDYGVESFAHNTIVIDDRPQAPGPKEVESPADNEIDCLITPEFDYLCAVCDHFRDVPAGQFRHQRSLFYLRGEYWLILDRITAPHPVEIQILWHWHPECQVQYRPGHIYTANTGRHNLSIASWHQHKLELHTQLVRGVDEGGRLQGWYSPCYNQISAAPVTISQTSAGPDTFILHLLQPSEPGSIVSAPPALSWEMSSDQRMLHVDIVFPESQARHCVVLPLAAGASSRPSFQHLSG